MEVFDKRSSKCRSRCRRIWSVMDKNNTANELWFTNDAGNDIPISLQPFIKTSQFQDDVGTTQHYIPFNNITEQSTNGTENVGFIAPFNMTLQKVAIKCSEDISGATIEVGMWAINDGSATNHHPVASQNNVDVTGGTAHTNAVADFTGTVGSGSSGSGGSNAISAGQFVDISIQLDSDETSSSAEWWVTCYFQQIQQQLFNKRGEMNEHRGKIKGITGKCRKV